MGRSGAQWEAGSGRLRGRACLGLELTCLRGCAQASLGETGAQWGGGAQWEAGGGGVRGWACPGLKFNYSDHLSSLAASLA